MDFAVTEKGVKWFSSYITKMIVKCCTTASNEMTKSDEFNISYSTAQGSCLGPLLFIIFVMIYIEQWNTVMSYYLQMTLHFTLHIEMQIT